jgi:lipoyl synthase
MTQTYNNNSAQKPPWLKVRAGGNKKYLEVQSMIREHNLHTVCQEANCPNRGECFSDGTATFLIMGPRCTRSCRFCDIETGRPAPLDPQEPDNLVRTVKLLGLKYVVITSVDRDDLPDGGAGHFAAVVKALRDFDRNISIEVLTPDFKGRKKDVLTVLYSGPDMFNHNIETVPRLYRDVRPGANYKRSLDVLRIAADFKRVGVKSGLMVGLGESVEELNQVFVDLKKAGVNYLTIGQYLAPSIKHYPVVKYYHPLEFQNLAEKARDCGIESVFSGPLVRSSYHAKEQSQSR